VVTVRRRRMRRSKVDVDQLQQSVDVGRVHVDVVVRGVVEPQRRQDVRTSLVDEQAVSEVADFVLLAVDHQHRRHDVTHLLDADISTTTQLHQALSLSLSLLLSICPKRRPSSSPPRPSPFLYSRHLPSPPLFCHYRQPPKSS